jgi:3-hydroxyacyl-CoA dehydrogenase
MTGGGGSADATFLVVIVGTGPRADAVAAALAACPVVAAGPALAAGPVVAAGPALDGGPARAGGQALAGGPARAGGPALGSASTLARGAGTRVHTTIVADVSGLAVDPLLLAADLVVEAAPDEPLAGKAAAVAGLLGALPARLPIAVVARLHRLETLLPGPRHGSRLVGLHLVSPGRQLRADRPVVAEVVLPAAFDDAMADAVLELLEVAGVVALPCSDAPGRIVDRLLATAALEARDLAADGVAAPDAVATAAARRGIDLGALAGGDLEAVVEGIHAGLGEADRFRLRPVTVAGRSGQDRSALMEDTVVERIELAVIAEAYRMVGEAVAGAEEIERAMTQGVGWTAGPFTLAGRSGLRTVVTELVALSRAAGQDLARADRFSVPSLLWQMATV